MIVTVRLYIHTIVSHRIDPTEEFKGSVGRPTDPDLLQMTKKRPCKQSGFAEKRTLEQKSC